MVLDYTTRREVKMDMRKYVENMIGEFTVNIEKAQAVTSLATDNIIKAEKIKPLSQDKEELFHTTVDRGFLNAK